MHPRSWAFHILDGIRQPFSRFMRRRRMVRLVALMQPRPGERLTDLGGNARFRAALDVPLDITVPNLPREVDRSGAPPHHRMTCLEGDATATGLPDGAFDIAVSNSVIEHVGGPGKQRAFAAEARRLAPRHRVQTPSIWFPVEAHTHMPFRWAYPAPLKRWFIRRWEAKLPAWCETIKGTTVITRAELAAMFPDSAIWTGRFAGLPKSYVAWRAKSAESRAASSPSP
jgi:hypothetical protein